MAGNPEAAGGALARHGATIGRLIAFAIALQAIFVSYFGTPEPGVHRSVSLLLCTAAVILLVPLASRLGDRGAAVRDAAWVLDLAMLVVVGLACWRFIDAIDDMENLVASFSVFDQWIALLALCSLIELTRRLFGLPLALVAIVAIVYCLFGAELPWIFRHSGFTLEEMTEVVWYGFQGVFGLPTAIVLSLIMIYIIFGAVLEATGAGESLIKVAFAIAGGSRGGPAHAAIIASAIFGTMSGSVAANVVGTGTFTIPLIKRRGFRPVFAAAVEAAASTGGQIMPPVMGAAVFLMAELIGVPYVKLCIAALLPALLYYGSLFVIVALQARRMDIQPIPPEERERLTRTDLLHTTMFLVPIAVIVAVLVAGRTPAMAGFWATMAAIAMGIVNPEVRRQPMRLLQALVRGGASSAKIMMAVGAIGVLLAILDLTGISLRFASAINVISGSSLFVALLVAAVACLVLGMGMPTFPAYLIIVLVLGPAIKVLGVPEVAMHLFVFYFGVLSAITPPVALAAFAAAPIAGARPMETAAHACALALSGFLIPFFFVFDNSMLLILGFTWTELAWTLVRACASIWLLSTAIAGFEAGRIGMPMRVLRIALAVALVYQDAAVQSAALAAGVLVTGLSHLSSRRAGVTAPTS